MASNPTLNRDPGQGPRPVRSVVFPIILIIVGGLFLYANWKPGFDAWRVLGTYWPLILIFLGLGKIWDNTRASGGWDRTSGPPRGRSTGLSLGILAFVLVMIALLWHGRSFSHAAGSSSSMRHTERTLELGRAKTVSAQIDLASGELDVSGGSANLLDAKFDDRESAGEPQVSYDQQDNTGELKIQQEKSGTHILIPGHSESRWDLRFGSAAPLDLKIDLGAGQGNVNLRGLPVTKLVLNLGAGQVNADLTGDRKQDLDADIEGGVGEAVIRLPRNVAVEVEASGGIGSIDTHGLRKEDGRYVNDAYGKGGPTIHLKVEGGIGHISLTEE
jgi:hypothetical protein